MWFIPFDEVFCERCFAPVHNPCTTPSGRLTETHAKRVQSRADHSVWNGFVLRLLVDVPEEGLTAGEEYLAFTHDMGTSTLIERVSDGWNPRFTDNGWHPAVSVSSKDSEFVRWAETGEKFNAMDKARSKAE